MRRGVALSPVEMPWPGSSSATVRMPRSRSIAASGRNCVLRPRQPCSASTSGPDSPQLRACRPVRSSIAFPSVPPASSQGWVGFCPPGREIRSASRRAACLGAMRP